MALITEMEWKVNFSGTAQPAVPGGKCRPFNQEAAKEAG
jgi:hypothetical protein